MGKLPTVIVSSPITALAISALSMLFQLADPILNKWFIYFFVLLLALYFIFLLLKIISERRKKSAWKRQIRFNAVFEKVEHDWQITEEGDFFGKYLYVVKNIGADPIHALPYDDVAWQVMPEQAQFKTEVINTGTGKYKIAGDRGSSYESFFDWNEGSRKSYLIFWHHIVSPPLQPKDSLTFVKSIHTPKTEVAALSEEGALAGIPVNIPTEQATIRYLCPPHYKFILLDEVLVFDMAGKRHPELEKNVKPPVMNLATNIVTWTLKDLRVGYRYNYRYRIVPNQ